MRRPLLLLAALASLSAPAIAQSNADQRRWDEARVRYDRETAIFEAERARYEAARGEYGVDRDGRPLGGGRDFDEREFATDYDASRDYRAGPRYRERVLAADDQVYRGSDGQYYCRRSDGTTGLIIGGATGGILGNVIDGGRRRTAGTLIGGALGALLGRSVDQQNAQVRCR